MGRAPAVQLACLTTARGPEGRLNFHPELCYTHGTTHVSQYAIGIPLDIESGCRDGPLGLLDHITRGDDNDGCS